MDIISMWVAGDLELNLANVINAEKGKVKNCKKL